MPEIRLAWRAKLCHSSSQGHVLVGTAPACEEQAVIEVYARQVRLYPIGEVQSGERTGVTVEGIGDGEDVFGLIPIGEPVSDQNGVLWDSLVTVGIKGMDLLVRYAGALSINSGERLFVLARGWSPGDERRLFDGLAGSGRLSGVQDLCGTVERLCRASAGA